MNQSLYDIINNQPSTFVDEILQCEDLVQLKQKLKRTRNQDRKAIIQARIENLTYLAV